MFMSPTEALNSELTTTSQCCYAMERNEKIWSFVVLNMGLNATKIFFRVSDKVRLKAVSSATETS